MKVPRVVKAKGFTTNMRPSKTPSRVLSEVERNLIKRDGTKQRRAWGIHPSELSKPQPCSRRMYYQLAGWGEAAHLELVEPSHTESFNARSLQIFAEGHSIHDKWQGWMWDAGVLWGAYKCINCDHYWFDTAPSQCPECSAGRTFLRYMEVPIRNEEHLIVGHADGKVRDDLTEIKSVGLGTVRIELPDLYEKHSDPHPNYDRIWAGIRRPFPSHVKQGMLYAWCHGARSMVYIYEWKANQATKEFVVNVTMAVLEPLLDLCLDVKYALRKGEPPRRNYMQSSDACKKCEYRGPCWQTKNQKEDTSADEADPVVVIRIPAP